MGKVTEGHHPQLLVMSYQLRSQGPLTSLVASIATHPRSAPAEESAEGSRPIASSTQVPSFNIQMCVPTPACLPIRSDQVTFTQALQLVATPALPDSLITCLPPSLALRLLSHSG